MINLPTLLLVIGFLFIILGFVIWVRSSRRGSSEFDSYRDPIDSLSLNELIFFEKAMELPSQYAEYLSPSRGRSFLIPAQSSQVGHLQVHIQDHEFNVKVGDHTDVDFHNPSDAIDFIAKILLDEIVFCFYGDQVDTHVVDDFDSQQIASAEVFVWSGRFQDQMAI